MSRSVSAPSSVTNTSPCWNGLIVPGSTLMYGSSLRLVTRMPREARMAASDAAAMPVPSEETTPPVTNTNLVMGDKFWKFAVYTNCSCDTNACSTAWNNGSPLDRRRRLGQRPLQSFAGTLAPHEREHRNDCRCLRRPGDKRTHRHHDLRRLEVVLCGN